MDATGFGIAMGMGANLRDADNALAEWITACNERDETIRNLQAEIVKLTAQTQVDASVIAGLNAYIKTVQTLSPKCEALSATGEFYGNGKAVTVADKAYGDAFDAKASAQGRNDLIIRRRTQNMAA